MLEINEILFLIIEKNLHFPDLALHLQPLGIKVGGQFPEFSVQKGLPLILHGEPDLIEFFLFAFLEGFESIFPLEVFETEVVVQSLNLSKEIVFLSQLLNCYTQVLVQLSQF